MFRHRRGSGRTLQTADSKIAKTTAACARHGSGHIESADTADREQHQIDA